MITDIVKDNECCGCTACASICPLQCIHMSKNGEGFLYPTIDKSLCIDCQKCERVCPVLHTEELNDNKPLDSLAAVSRDKNILLNCSSGGVFPEISRVILEEGGCVVGAAFAEDYYSVNHIVVTDTCDLVKLQGSKYLQSQLEGCYNGIRNHLENGETVLFSGTPCQVSGLKSYLGKDYDSLICIDVICHGVPSSSLWRKYLTYIEKNGKADAVNFRHKESSFFSDGFRRGYYRNMREDAYMKMFLHNYCLRESCYNCRVKEKGSRSDITVGDFWGIGEVLSGMDISQGISLVLLRTEKGNTLFNRIRERMNCVSVDFDSAIAANPSLVHSANRPNERSTFYDDMNSISWTCLVKKYNIQTKYTSILFRKIKRRIKWMKRVVFGVNNTRETQSFSYGLFVHLGRFRKSR